MKHLILILLIFSIPGFGQKFTLTSLPNPSAAGSIQPNWSVTPDGAAVLSWIEPSKDGAFSLRYAVRRGTAWSEAHTVTAKRNFFRHPAEAPEVVMVADHLWFAHWVEMPSESSEAEYIYVSSSADGLKWSAPLIAHRDRKPIQHGLASLVGGTNNQASLIWLEAAQGEDGPSYLMRSIIDATGKEIKEEKLDTDVCTCCPTAVAKTARGLIIAYRDHTADDLRDISTIRLENDKWSQPKTVHADNWKINACPVNAAAVAARGDHTVVAWYTGVQETPKVQAVFSADGGSNFGQPILVSTGHAFGFTSTALIDDRTSMVSWLERGNSGTAKLLVRQIDSAGAVGPTVQATEGSKQGLGYPRLTHSAAGTFIVWSDTAGKLQTARIDK
jgi:hypothetical protein